MKVVEVNGNKYIDQNLFDHINQIWLNYDIEVDKNSCIYFTKNTTVNRLITDYTGKNISRVIKREKADYVVINKFMLNNFPQYFDGINITEDDTKEVVYGIYNHSLEIQDTIELILDFNDIKQDVKYVNQNKLNDSLNNGFVIDKESYITIKELIDSSHSDNHQLAVNMIVQSDLKANWQWLLYLYHGKYNQLQTYDRKSIVVNYFNTMTNVGYSFATLAQNLDSSLSVVIDKDVKDRFIYLVKSKFQDSIKTYLSSLGTSKFKLNDFKIEYDGSL